MLIKAIQGALESTEYWAISNDIWLLDKHE